MKNESTQLISGTAEVPGITRRAHLRLTDIHKFVNSNGARRITGIASSITVDRAGDVVVPTGGTWRLPVPLLFQHSHSNPVGRVTQAEVRGNQIVIEAQLAEDIDRVDEIWSLIQQGVLDSFSIGFRGIDWEPLPNGGRKWTRWELLEVSVVSVPAQPDAKFDAAALAATGQRKTVPRDDHNRKASDQPRLTELGRKAETRTGRAIPAHRNTDLQPRGNSEMRTNIVQPSQTNDNRESDTCREAFIEIARSMVLGGRDSTAVIERSTNIAVRRLIERSAPTVLAGDFQGVDGNAIQSAYAQSLVDESILDACLAYAKVLPSKLNRVIVASGSTASATAEGQVRVIADPGVSVADADAYQVATIFAFSLEALKKGGAATQALFDNELRNAIVRGLNAEMRSALDTSSTVTIATTGNAADDLRAALAKADPAAGYVYAAPGNVVAALATDPANRGAGIRGGEFIPGVRLVADDAIDSPTLIPAGALVLRDEGLRLNPGPQASVNWSASPSSPSTQTSLWQCGCGGVAAFREWRMNADGCTLVKVG